MAAALTLALIGAACSAQPPFEPSVTPLIIYVTPAPTPTTRPTPEPTTDIRPDWFAAACETASYLRGAFDAWLEAVDSADQGDPDGVLDWVGYGYDALDDAADAMDSIPEWDEAGSFVSAAESLYRALDEDLSRVENDPLVDISSSDFSRILDLRSDLFFAADDVPGSGDPGCDIRLLFS